MKKISMSVAALEGFKQMIAESEEPLREIEELRAMLARIATGQPLPMSADERALDEDDPDDAEVIEQIQRDPASQKIAMNFDSADEVAAWLKKECGYAH